MAFYDNFVRLCAKRGVSPSAVAETVGMDRSAASRWARGSAPRNTTLVDISDYFGVTVEELLGDEKVATVANNATTTDVNKMRTTEDDGLSAALEALRNQPGRRALLSATKNMTEAQVLRFADWLADITGGDKY